jgi:ribonuclease D
VPAAAARLGAIRDAVTALATEHSVEPQQLLAGDLIRRLAWEPPAASDAVAVAAWLGDQGARPWQIELCSAPLAAALARAIAAPGQDADQAADADAPDAASADA